MTSAKFAQLTTLALASVLCLLGYVLWDLQMITAGGVFYAVCCLIDIDDKLRQLIER